MADTSNLIGYDFTESFDGQDSLTAIYKVVYDSRPSSAYTAIARARAAGPDPLPPIRHQYASPTAWMFAKSFAMQTNRSDDSAQVIDWTVSYSPPPPGETEESFGQDNPLARAPTFQIQYMDREDVIAKAKNVGALPHGNGSGGNRADDTEGPIVNAAGKRPDEPMVDTTRLEVLVITKNYPSLASIVTRNRTYKKTTNSDSAQGYSARELRYLLTESHGEQFENGVRFWPGTTTILADETTDLTIDNVGYEFWNAADSDWERVKDTDGNFMAEPINLKIDGDKGGTTTNTITYRYLAPVAYSGLFT